jgi:hypothetical protein
MNKAKVNILALYLAIDIRLERTMDHQKFHV